MSSFDAQEHATNRGLEDAKAANAVTQATGQILVVINGGAATATLTFSSADKAPVHFGLLPLGLSLLFFAAGVFYGARYLGLQGERLQYWSTYWDSRGGIWPQEMGEQARGAANSMDERVGSAFRFSVRSLLLGVSAIGVSLISENINIIFNMLHYLPSK